jgi:hypothetical protein
MAGISFYNSEINEQNDYHLGLIKKQEWKERQILLPTYLFPEEMN